MKTKNIIAILAALPIVAGFTGCKSDEETTAKPAKEILMVVGGDVIEYRANETGPANGVNISADCPWKVEVDKGTFGEDISVSPQRGSGNGSLVIVSNQNTDPNLVREAVITLISDGGLKQKVTVRQKGGDDALNVTATKFSFKEENNEPQTLVVTSNVSWTLANPHSWIQITDADGAPVTSGGKGATTLLVKVSDAVSDAERTGTFTINYGKDAASIEVTQDGKSNIVLRVVSTPEKFSYYGGTQTIRIESNAEWTAFVPSSAASWLSIEGVRDSSGVNRQATGVGNGEITIRCAENNTTRELATAIVITAGSKSPKQEVVVIEQAGNSSAQPLQTAVELYSLTVMRNAAKFLLSIVSEEVVGEYGLVYSTGASAPTRGSSPEVVAGQGITSGGVTCDLTNLQESTTYYVRAFVVKPSSGETIYSGVVPITTPAGETRVGQVSVLSYGKTSAECYFGFASDNEVGEYGFAYSTSNSTPTISDEVRVVGVGGTSGNVQDVLNGLQEGTTYYVRGFVYTTSGVVYSSNVATFTTRSSSIMMGQLYSLYVANTSAEFRFAFTSDEEVGEYGLVYSPTSQTPTTSDGIVAVGNGGTGSNVMGTIDGLSEDTEYFVRAYVITVKGTVYSNNMVTIRTSKSAREPGESDNPDPTLSRRW